MLIESHIKLSHKEDTITQYSMLALVRKARLAWLQLTVLTRWCYHCTGTLASFTGQIYLIALENNYNCKIKSRWRPGNEATSTMN